MYLFHQKFLLNTYLLLLGFDVPRKYGDINMRLKIVVSLSRKIARQLQRRYSKMRLLLWLQEVVICLVFQTFFYIKSPQTTKKVSLLKKGVCIRITLVAYLLTYQIFKVLSIGQRGRLCTGSISS